MRAIVTIFAVLMLLLISIAMLGFISLWMKRSARNATSEIERRAEMQTLNRMKLIRIDDAISSSPSILKLRNIGRVELRVGELSIYFDNELVSCVNLEANATIFPGERVECYVPKTCNEVKVIAPGNVDLVDCRSS